MYTIQNKGAADGMVCTPYNIIFQLKHIDYLGYPRLVQSNSKRTDQQVAGVTGLVTSLQTMFATQ
jgi:hypothetical protein